MDVRLSPEQDALRDAAAQMVDRLGPHSVAQLGDPKRADKLEAAVASAGWRELRVAEDDGAPLASGVEVAIVAEELGRGLADVPFLGPTLAAELRRLAGAPAATGPETVVLGPTLANPAAAAGDAVPSDALAVDAAGAVSALLLVPSGGDLRLAQVGLSASEVRTDLTRPVARLRPPARVVPDGAGGRPLSADDLQRWMALGLAVTCADLVGTMRGAVHLTVDYARSRQQFGRSIGSFQAVQHLLADAQVQMEGSASVARHAAWAVDALPADAALDAAAVAKAYCARAARTVCETAIQVHGGIGNTWECLAHVHLRRALMSGQLLGGTGASLQRVLAQRGIASGIEPGIGIGIEIGGDDGLR
jgi:alkylation response protein AidB-like acyl-CoA dehydrogenase